jgi:hypothetical protein
MMQIITQMSGPNVAEVMRLPYHLFFFQLEKWCMEMKSKVATYREQEAALKKQKGKMRK